MHCYDALLLYNHHVQFSLIKRQQEQTTAVQLTHTEWMNSILAVFKCHVHLSFFFQQK